MWIKWNVNSQLKPTDIQHTTTAYCSQGRLQCYALGHLDIHFQFQTFQKSVINSFEIIQNIKQKNEIIYIYSDTHLTHTLTVVAVQMYHGCCFLVQMFFKLKSCQTSFVDKKKQQDVTHLVTKTFLSHSYQIKNLNNNNVVITCSSSQNVNL